MAGQRPEQKKPATDAATAGEQLSADALIDALNATQQHSAPLLPSFDDDTRTTGTVESQTARVTTPQTQTSYARRTLAPRPGDVSHPTGRAVRLSAGEASGTRRQTDAPDPQPGRPTITLPAVTAAQLPAVLSAERQVARPTTAEGGALLIRGARKPRAHTRMPVVPRRTKPRSFAAQFIVAMVSVMALVTALTLASPLAQTSAFANTFQAYANAVPWIPTPTPTPKPTPTPVPYHPPIGANPGQQAIINEIVAVFGPNAQGALNIARCESGYDPNAVNPYAIGNSHASGVFQILYPSTWNGTSYAAQSPFDYNANIHAAFEIFSRDGYSWREWACKPY